MDEITISSLLTTDEQVALMVALSTEIKRLKELNQNDKFWLYEDSIKHLSAIYAKVMV